MSTKSDAAAVAVESIEVSFNNSTNTVHDFVSNVTGLVIKTTADVRIGFDQPANADDFLLTAGNGLLILDRCHCTKLYFLGESGSGTAYVIGMRR